MAIRCGTPSRRSCPECAKAGTESVVMRRGWRTVFLNDTLVGVSGQNWQKPLPPRVLVDYVCSEGHRWEEVAARVVNEEPED